MLGALITDWGTDNTLTLLALVIASIGLGLTYLQIRSGVTALQESAKANEQSQLMALLALEGSLAEARSKAMDAKEQLDHSPDDPQIISRLEACKEHYLNTLDRFCHCVRLGLVDEEIYRQDYRDRIKQAIDRNQTSFGPGSSFRHIERVNSAWADEKSAADYVTKRKSSQR